MDIKTIVEQTLVAPMRQQASAARIDELEVALNRMVHTFENAREDSEGHYPVLDIGCIECTEGATPGRLNTGLCAYHNAKKLLGHVC